jgi:hypothetical protein
LGRKIVNGRHLRRMTKDRQAGCDLRHKATPPFGFGGVASGERYFQEYVG